MAEPIRSGNIFGRWEVLSLGPRTGKSDWHAYFNCLCVCGNLRVVNGSSLLQGNSVSCGCIKKDHPNHLTHGQSGSREYRIYTGMLTRCYNDHADGFRNYGGRGIKVCDRWQGQDGFKNFLADVGKRPSPKYSLDRYPNNDGDYEPGNVRWATPEQQANNCRTNIRLTIDGSTKTLPEWARLVGISESAAYARFYAGWSQEDCIRKPVDKTAGRFIGSKMITINGETRSMTEWGKVMGFPPYIIKNRVRNGWDSERAVLTPWKGYGCNA